MCCQITAVRGACIAETAMKKAPAPCAKNFVEKEVALSGTVCYYVYINRNLYTTLKSCIQIGAALFRTVRRKHNKGKVREKRAIRQPSGDEIERSKDYGKRLFNKRCV